MQGSRDRGWAVGRGSTFSTRTRPHLPQQEVRIQGQGQAPLKSIPKMLLRTGPILGSESVAQGMLFATRQTQE